MAALDEELARRERHLTEELRTAQAASVAQLGEVEVWLCDPRSWSCFGANFEPGPRCET